MVAIAPDVVTQPILNHYKIDGFLHNGFNHYQNGNFSSCYESYLMNK